MTSLDPSIWQRSAIDGLTKRLSRTRGARAALLQLPTGFGKSLVAVRVFDKLRRRKPGLSLVVVLQKQNIASGWLAALGFPRDADVPMFHWIHSKAVKGLVRFETARTLKRAMLDPSRGRPPRLATMLHAHPCLIVVDEVHRHRKFLDTLSWLFRGAEEAGEDPEAYLTAPFRSPPTGARRWPKWLLLSATPFNPVRLDSIDPLDGRASDETFEDQQREEEDALADEVENTLGALGRLAGLRRGVWFHEHIEQARRRLTDGAKGPALHPPDELIVWPASVQQRAFRPQAARRWTMDPPRVDGVLLQQGLRQVVLTAVALDRMPGEGARRATAERFVLSGGLLSVNGHRIQGELYGPSLSRSVKAIVSAHRRNGISRPAKLESLVRLLQHLRDRDPKQHVLIFCVHRAVAVAVAEAARQALNERAPFEVVRTAIGAMDETDRRWFTREPSGKTRILVATDACSESIDLHLSSNLLVHYELPWSPLRVLQRLGRLWRIRPKEIAPGARPATPKLPGVVHFAHPGSVDEEILSRLHRRWGHLSALGLDYLSYEEALGTRLPAVEWPPGG